MDMLIGTLEITAFVGGVMLFFLGLAVFMEKIRVEKVRKLFPRERGRFISCEMYTRRGRDYDSYIFMQRNGSYVGYDFADGVVDLMHLAGVRRRDEYPFV